MTSHSHSLSRLDAISSGSGRSMAAVARRAAVVRRLVAAHAADDAVDGSPRRPSAVPGGRRARARGLPPQDLRSQDRRHGHRLDLDVGARLVMSIFRYVADAQGRPLVMGDDDLDLVHVGPLSRDDHRRPGAIPPPTGRVRIGPRRRASGLEPTAGNRRRSGARAFPAPRRRDRNPPTAPPPTRAKARRAPTGGRAPAWRSWACAPTCREIPRIEPRPHQHREHHPGRGPAGRRRPALSRPAPADIPPARSPPAGPAGTADSRGGRGANSMASEGASTHSRHDPDVSSRTVLTSPPTGNRP